MDKPKYPNEDREQPLKLSSKQTSINDGLKKIGEEISSFYLDGIRVFQSSGMRTKSYLLAHIAREIEGGIRGAFVGKDIESAAANLERDFRISYKQIVQKFIDTIGTKGNVNDRQVSKFIKK